jgi:hypothetical protein
MVCDQAAVISCVVIGIMKALGDCRKSLLARGGEMLHLMMKMQTPRIRGLRLLLAALMIAMRMSEDFLHAFILLLPGELRLCVYRRLLHTQEVEVGYLAPRMALHL